MFYPNKIKMYSDLPFPWSTRYHTETNAVLFIWMLLSASICFISVYVQVFSSHTMFSIISRNCFRNQNSKVLNNQSHKPVGRPFLVFSFNEDNTYVYLKILNQIRLHIEMH